MNDQQTIQPDPAPPVSPREQYMLEWAYLIIPLVLAILGKKQINKRRRKQCKESGG